MWGDEMKKLLLFAAVFLALFTNAQAKPGDKAGYIYATDIRTYINSHYCGGHNSRLHVLGAAPHALYKSD